jgi:hypothetical protein
MDALAASSGAEIGNPTEAPLYLWVFRPKKSR